MSIAQRLQFNTLRFIGKLKQGDALKYLCDQIHYVHLTLGSKEWGQHKCRKCYSTTHCQTTLRMKQMQISSDESALILYY